MIFIFKAEIERKKLIDCMEKNMADTNLEIRLLKSQIKRLEELKEQFIKDHEVSLYNWMSVMKLY